MSAPTGSEDQRRVRRAVAAIVLRRCPRCRSGSIFRALWVMNDDCPACGLDFDRGDPGHFTGAMYVSYALAIPLIALLTLIEHLAIPRWSLFRLVVLATGVSLPLVPWIWQYSRVVWIYLDRFFDPSDQPSAGGLDGTFTREHDAEPEALQPGVKPRESSP